MQFQQLCPKMGFSYEDRATKIRPNALESNAPWFHACFEEFLFLHDPT